jgi:predicted oxidoreductase (fatty acid repression mutant protein)
MYKNLNKDNAIVTTQREMVRYTEEKNAYTANQIAVWTALNVVTLGAILFVYRN